MILFESQASQKPEDPARHIHGWRIKQSLMIGKRNLIEDLLIVVLVKRRPTAIGALHTQKPGQGTLAFGEFPSMVGNGNAVQGDQQFRGIVAVRVQLVIKFKRPASRFVMRIFDFPVSGFDHLFFQNPCCRFDQGRMVRGQAGIQQGIAGDACIPKRRNTRLEECSIPLVDQKSVDGLESLDDRGMVLGITQMFQSQQRIEHGRLDTAKIPFILLVFHRPLLSFPAGHFAERFPGKFADEPDKPVQINKRILPGKKRLGDAE